MADTIGVWRYRRSHSVPGSGQVAFTGDPAAGLPNTLRVNVNDVDAVDQSALLDAFVSGDLVIGVIPSVRTFSSVIGTPTSSGTWRGFPVTISTAFLAADEPVDNTQFVLQRDQVAAPVPAVIVSGDGWPELAEIAQVVDVENLAASPDGWGTTIARIRASAIETVKGDVGAWDDDVDEATEKLAAAALRMAELMSLRPDSSVESLRRDAAYAAHLSGKRKRFALA